MKKAKSTQTSEGKRGIASTSSFTPIFLPNSINNNIKKNKTTKKNQTYNINTNIITNTNTKAQAKTTRNNTNESENITSSKTTSQEEEEDNTPIKTQFRYDKSYFFCCSKLIPLYFLYAQNLLSFYTDSDYSKLFLSIRKDEVVCVNKRQTEVKDVYKFSIYYMKQNKPNIINELKLKTSSRFEADKWIQVLKEILQPKKTNFEFYKNNNYIDSEEKFKFKNRKKEFFGLRIVEYIFYRNKFRNFFEYYRESLEKINRIMMESSDGETIEVEDDQYGNCSIDDGIKLNINNNKEGNNNIYNKNDNNIEEKKEEKKGK